MQCAVYGLGTDSLTPHPFNLCSNAGSTHTSISQTQSLDMTLSTCTQLLWSTMERPVLSGTCPDVQHWRQQVEKVRGALCKVREQCQSLDSMKEFCGAQMSSVKGQRLRELDEAWLQWATVQSQLKMSDLEEIKSYRAPPPLVVMVTDALCILFEKEPGWENARLMIGQDELYQMLQFYDVHGMSDRTFCSLTQAVSGSKFNVNVVRPASTAAASLCEWLCGLQRHSAILRKLKSRKASLAGLEAREMEVMEEIIARRQQEHKLKKMEAQSILNLQEAERKQEELSKKLTQLQQSYEVVKDFQQRITPHAAKWRDALQAHHRCLFAAPADALLVAASVSYLGWLPWKRFIKLLEKWKELMQGVEVSLDPDDVRDAMECPNPGGTNKTPHLLHMLSTSVERLNWHRHRLFVDGETQTRACLLRTSAQYLASRSTLLIDPKQQGEHWLRALLGELAPGQGSATQITAISTDPGCDIDCIRNSLASAKKKAKLHVIDSCDTELNKKLQLAQTEEDPGSPAPRQRPGVGALPFPRQRPGQGSDLGESPCPRQRPGVGEPCPRQRLGAPALLLHRDLGALPLDRDQGEPCPSLDRETLGAETRGEPLPFPTQRLGAPASTQRPGTWGNPCPRHRDRGGQAVTVTWEPCPQTETRGVLPYTETRGEPCPRQRPGGSPAETRGGSPALPYTETRGEPCPRQRARWSPVLDRDPGVGVTRGALS
ncbi:Hypothetical predicted protein [Pelobates cultripes]|uniref:Dynein heavy chain coiled coil stalk domain-containing protein n=1 Tax=Pelobates cultripes TaxID=61616 RepID=A0AAD1RAY7_PELCU|nr:Hypothetical predicted protein [Pelobates cultripes]